MRLAVSAMDAVRRMASCGTSRRTHTCERVAESGWVAGIAAAAIAVRREASWTIKSSMDGWWESMKVDGGAIMERERGDKICRGGKQRKADETSYWTTQ